MEYEHTQRGHFHQQFLLLAAVLLFIGWLTREQLEVAGFVFLGAAVLITSAAIFTTLTIRDEGEYLQLVFGPLPLLRKRIKYADITAVESGRSSLIDGWGIHYIPGRGTTYNIWGFGCVKLALGKKVVRIGSDDVDGLTAFLQRKLAQQDRG